MSECRICVPYESRANQAVCQILTKHSQFFRPAMMLAHCILGCGNIEQRNAPRNLRIGSAPFCVTRLWTSRTSLKTKEMKPRNLC